MDIAIESEIDRAVRLHQPLPADGSARQRFEHLNLDHIGGLDWKWLIDHGPFVGRRIIGD